MKLINRGLFILIMFSSIIVTINCGRISFKDKLTAYAEKSEVIETKANQVKASSESVTQNPPSNYKSIGELNAPGYNKPTHNHGDTNYSRTSKHKQIPASGKPDQKKTLSSWEITKNHERTEPNFKNSDYGGIESGSVYSEKSRSENSLQNGTKVVSVQQAWKDFLMTVKTGFHGVMRKGSEKEATRNSSSSIENYVNYEIQQQQQEQEQQRTKKDVGGTGLRDVMWNTAKALWSVNREHFLPTFLHTKTGGKLSLIRDSIFKPVAILSQYKSGVREINNEKWKNLGRLTSFGSGWGNPKSEVVVVKYQAPSTPFLTLARYILRLGKHTVVTKWRLKRALLDLQIRALKKLLRIISNQNISQKIAIIKILTNAIWKGKRAFLRIVTGNKHSSSPSDETTYEGKDNAFNIDITYGSLSKPAGNSDDSWRINNFQPNVRDTFTPPPPLIPPHSPHAYSSYYPSYQAPTPPSSLYTVPDPLIESPSYAHVLKTMGVHPSNYQYQPHDDDERSSAEPVPPTLPSSTPTVLYYSDDASSDHHQKPVVTFDKNPVMEKPTSSYSYHYSGPQLHETSPSNYLPYLSKEPHESNLYSNANSVLRRSTTTPSPFRLKLLEYMSGTTL